MRADAMRIVGLAIRTSNAEESNPAEAKIPSLWGRFMAEQWPGQLEALGAFGPVIAVYSAYESDVTGSYQLLVGRQVHGAAVASSPVSSVSTQGGAYLVFKCTGPVPQAVIDGWRDVWAFFEREAAPKRSYTYDFEIYRDGTPVEIWVAVRES